MATVTMKKGEVIPALNHWSHEKARAFVCGSDELLARAGVSVEYMKITKKRDVNPF